MQTMVMAKGVKEEFEGMFVMPNMDWKHCQHRCVARMEGVSYCRKGKGKEEYGDLEASAPFHVPKISAYQSQNLDVSTLEHTYSSILDSIGIHQLKRG